MNTVIEKFVFVAGLLQHQPDIGAPRHLAVDRLNGWRLSLGLHSADSVRRWAARVLGNAAVVTAYPETVLAPAAIAAEGTRDGWFYEFAAHDPGTPCPDWYAEPYVLLGYMLRDIPDLEPPFDVEVGARTVELDLSTARWAHRWAALVIGDTGRVEAHPTPVDGPAFTEVTGVRDGWRWRFRGFSV